MGEYADDLIDAGMMEDNPFGYHTHKSKVKPKVEKPEKPEVDFIAFTKWFNSHNWGSCSQFEICSMAWHEVTKRLNSKADNIDDDHFTWWFDSYEFVGIFKDSPLALMAWNEAKKRCFHD